MAIFAGILGGSDNCTGASKLFSSGEIWHLEGQPFDNKASSIRVIQA